MDCQDFPLRMNFIQRSSLFQVFDIMRLQLWQICASLHLGKSNIWEAWLGWDGSWELSENANNGSCAALAT